MGLVFNISSVKVYLIFDTCGSHDIAGIKSTFFYSGLCLV